MAAAWLHTRAQKGIIKHFLLPSLQQLGWDGLGLGLGGRRAHNPKKKIILMALWAVVGWEQFF